MANVLNRQTNLYLESVNTPEYDPAEWVINPDLTAVLGYPSSHWVINPDDTVSLLNSEGCARVNMLAPYQGMSVVEAIRAKHDEVNAYREVKLNDGWLYKGIHYDSDVVSRSNMTGVMTLVSTGYILPDGFTFRAQNNTDVRYDNAGFTAFYQCSCIWAEMIYKASWWHKGRIKGLTSIEDIAAYDYSAGWPEGFSGGN